MAHFRTIAADGVEERVAAHRAKESLVPIHITCPSCNMSASPLDHRQLQPIRPVMGEGDDLRRCRNCGDTLDVSNMVGAELG